MKSLLKKHWDKLYNQLGDSSNFNFSEVTFEMLFTNYFYDPQRHYHSAQHIRYCLDSLDALVEHFTKTRTFPIELVNFTAIKIAIWFHDFIYDTRQNNNEKLSALAAKQFVYGLSGTSELAEKVESLILFTKHDRKAVTAEEQILSDIDLSILGDYHSSYKEYSKDIRKEYGWAPDHVYYAGRLQILEALNGRDSIFYNEYFRTLIIDLELNYEENARYNISFEIKSIKETLTRLNGNSK